MIVVAGGSYWERCLHPGWNELRGSGLRAAIALSETAKVQFHTLAGPPDAELFDLYCKAHGIEAMRHESDQTVVFKYPTSLAVPMIWPRPDMLSRASLSVEAEHVLAFGMLDARVEARGEFLVYDPQFPAPRDRDGMHAKHLAIVANADEVRRWAGRDDLEIALQNVGRQTGAEVVVAKRGLRGALVISGSRKHEIPAYASSGAWTIGSGDIFSSAFAHCWFETGDAFLAADLASRSTAYYAAERTHPNYGRLSDLRYEPVIPKNGSVYLAGPFFSLPEHWLVEEAKANLSELGLEVLSPYHAVVSTDPQIFAKGDMEMLHRSTRVFALLDGFDPGTLFEVGAAVELGIPVVAFSRHARLHADERLNMLRGLGIEIYDDYAYAISRTLQVTR